MNGRNIVTIILCLFILSFPYWVYVPLLVVGIVIFPFYFEAILLAFIIDVLYGTRAYIGFSFVFPFASIVALLVVMVLPVRRYFRIDHA